MESLSGEDSIEMAQVLEKAFTTLKLQSMNCVIVDYDAGARARLVQLAGLVEGLCVEAEYGTATEAYQYCCDRSVDLLLLDIGTPDMSGLEVGRMLKETATQIVFTTVKKDYAAEAFDLNAADYLLKPVEPGRFLRAIDKVRGQLSRRRDAAASAEEECIFIRDCSVLRRLRFDDILFAEATGDYVKLHTRERNYSVHITFKTAEQRLPGGRFVRVHRSFIVALDKIDSLQDGGIFIGSKFVPVADTYRRALNQRIRVI
jgi:DNA-binding LytR/AlgR family response regulator